MQTERLTLSNWLPEDIDDLYLLHSDPDVSRYISGPPETRAQGEERLKLWADNFASQRMGKLRVTAREDGRFIGRAGFGLQGPPEGTPEIGYALLQREWGKGYATEAASALRDWIFRETAHDHFIGFADTRNTVSLAVLHRIGMKDTHVADFEGILCQFTIMRRA